MAYSMDLSGRVAFVTGASSGLGAQFARTLARAGAGVVMDIACTLHLRRDIARFGIAPLTSMYWFSETRKPTAIDWRPEVHDSDGLYMWTGAGERIWRPLDNPPRTSATAFMDDNPRGFGLIQRDRTFEHYQDLDLNYELRPSYWVEPREGWGEGRIELIESPTSDESDNNILAAWVPNAPVEQGKAISVNYRIVSSLDMRKLSPTARAISTYQTQARALGSQEPVLPGTRRFIIDFAGGELKYYQTQPELVEFTPSTTSGAIRRSFVTPNPQTGGFRAAFDVQLAPGTSADLRGYLRAGNRALTETWTYPWRAE